MNRFVQITIVGLLAGASSAGAQFVNSVWPGFKGTAAKQASATADGPAVNHAFTVTVDENAAVSSGGFTVDTDGDIYFQTHSTTQPGSYVYRLDPTDGSVLAKSVNLGGGGGNYGGVAIGQDAVYACVANPAASTTSIAKLHKDTLAVINTFTNPAFGSLRGTPIIGAVKNVNGNVNLYVHDRTNIMLHAVDSVTGQIMWSYQTQPSPFFGQAGPSWVDGTSGRDRIAFFANSDLGPGVVLEDNGDNTFTPVWEFGGPGNFNWWGSGALSDDGDNIYVTTFNDNFTASLWSIDAATGNILWQVDGMRGVCGQELNFFGRPAVKGNRVYCGGGFGVVAAFDDNGSSFTKAWEYRDNEGEHTACSVVELPNGDRYVYAVKQELTMPVDPMNDPCGAIIETGMSELVVLKDEGATYSLVLRTTVNGTMRRTLFGNNSATIDADGSLWVAGGRHDDGMKGQIVKFEVDAGCYPDCDGSGTLDLFDFLCFVNEFNNSSAYADCDGSGTLDLFDFLCFVNEFNTGCP